LEKARKQGFGKTAFVIQKAWRGYQSRRAFKKLRKYVVTLQARMKKNFFCDIFLDVRRWIQRKKYVKTVEAIVTLQGGRIVIMTRTDMD
jgi:hypothetical protein